MTQTAIAPQRRVQLVFNPASGHYDAARVARLRAEFERLGAWVTLAESSPNHDYFVDAKAERICVVGGDGTLRHVIARTHAAGIDVPIATYPGGTVNLFQMEAAYPADMTAFARRVLDGGDRQVLDATLDDTRFAVCASIGPDSAAVARLSLTLKRWAGQLAYVVAFLQVLWQWPRPTLCLRFDGREMDCEAVMIAKGRHYAGPWSFAPAASLGDARLHVLAFPQLTRWRFLRFAINLVLRRPPTRDPALVAFTTTALQIDSAAPVAVQADGDIVARTPCDIAVAATPYRIVA